MATGRGRAGAALTEAELLEIDALALVLFPPTDRVSAALVEQTARFWVQGRTLRMRPPPQYRAGLRALADASAATRFSALPPAAAQRVVARLMEAPAATAFGRLAADLLDGLYTSLPGWRLVGYATGPGYPAGRNAYTTAPGPA